MARVRISKAPKALSGLEVKMRPGLYGTNGNRQFSLPNQVNSQRFSQQPIDVRDTLQPVAREGANLEAEKGETAVVPINGLPAHFKIGGKRHHSGGTPLNLPDNSFIFSDTAKMKIKDPIVLAQFGMVPKKAGYTPAEIAKKYDINTFRKILSDPNSEDLERKTAEAMIAKYNMKLAKLALIQESMKGFPQGIPQVAMPYLIANNIDPKDFTETEAQEEQPDADMGVSRYGGNMISQFPTKKYGGLPKAQTGLFDFNTGSNNSRLSKKVSKPLKEYAPYENNKLVKDSWKPITEYKPSYVGKGFDNDPQQEEEFANDEDTKNAYLIYKNALASGKPDDLKRAIGDLSGDAFDVPGFAWYLGGKQNRISDLKSILQEELFKKTGEKSTGQAFRENMGDKLLDTRFFKEKEAQYQKDKVIPGKINDLYGKIKYLYDIETDPTQSQNYKKDLEKLEYLLPSAKKRSKVFQLYDKWGSERVDIDPETGEQIEILYDNAERDWVNDQYNLINKIVKAKTEQQIKEQKAERSKTSVRTPTTTVETVETVAPVEDKTTYVPIEDKTTYVPKTNSVIVDKKRNNSQPKVREKALEVEAYGGSIGLDKYQEAGAKEKEIIDYERSRSSGLARPIYSDNTKGEWENMESIVSPEDYTKLEALRNKAYAKEPSAKGTLETPESEEFQKAFHDIVPNTARNIIVKHGITQHGKNKKLKYWDLPTNVDKRYGKRTDEYWQALQKLKPKEPVVTAPPAAPPAAPPVVPPAPPKKEKEKPGEEVVVDIDPIKPYVLPKKAPWFIQDAIPFAGSLYDMATVNRYKPARFYPETRVPGAVYKSSEREAAKIGEAAQQAMAARATFGNTQGQAAANSAAQGIAGSQIADVFANTQNYNIGIANQLANTRADIMNQAGINRAGITKKFYDEGNIESQQYDNTMRALRDKRNLLLTNGITNAANAYNLNTLNPNYKTNPWQGGRIDYVSDNARFKPSKDYEKKDIWSNYQDALDKTGDPNAAIKMLQLLYGKGVSSKNDDDIAGYPS